MSDTTITRLQATVARPALCDNIVWIDCSTKERVLFVTEKLGADFDQAFLERMSRYTHFAVYDGDEATAARVDEQAAAYRASLIQTASSIDQAAALQDRRDLADANRLNEKLLAETRALRDEVAQLRAQLSGAAPSPRPQPDDIPENPESMDDLRLPGVGEGAPTSSQEPTSGGRRSRRS